MKFSKKSFLDSIKKGVKTASPFNTVAKQIVKFTPEGKAARKSKKGQKKLYKKLIKKTTKKEYTEKYGEKSYNRSMTPGGLKNKEANKRLKIRKGKEKKYKGLK